MANAHPSTICPYHLRRGRKLPDSSCHDCAMLQPEPAPRPSLDLLLRFVADAGRHSYFIDGEEVTQAEVEQMQQWLEAAARQGVDRA